MRVLIEENSILKRDVVFHIGDVRLQMQQVRELVLVKASLGRLNVAVVSASDVRTEAQRWQVILPSRSVNSYIG